MKKLVGAVLTLLLAVTACEDFASSTAGPGDEPAPTGGNFTLQKISGDEQTAPAGAELDDPYVVKVVDQFGGAVSGVNVRFRVQEGGGSISSSLVETGADGNAEVTARLPGQVNTGKTVVAMHRAKYLAEQMFADDSDQLQFTTYTRNLAADIEENLRKIKEDEEAGKKVQMRLLPPERWVFGPYSVSRQLMSSMELSGDFVDYFVIDNDHMGFYSADVSGHGVSSALVTVIIKSFIRKYQERHLNGIDNAILNPGALLERLNAELLAEDLEKHVTMFYGVLSSSRNLLRFASGGQFPSPFLWSDHGFETLRERGAAVGLFPFARYDTFEKRLPSAFLLAVFSDGVLDILPQETLDQKLGFLQSLGSDSSIGRFMAVVKTNAQPPDDVTVLTVRKEAASHGS